MKTKYRKKGTNLVEYSLIAMLVGVMFGVSINKIQPETYRGVFANTINGTQQAGGSDTAGYTIETKPIGQSI